MYGDDRSLDPFERPPLSSDDVSQFKTPTQQDDWNGRCGPRMNSRLVLCACLSSHSRPLTGLDGVMLALQVELILTDAQLKSIRHLVMMAALVIVGFCGRHLRAIR